MNMFQLVWSAFKLWPKYGPTFTNFAGAVEEITNLNEGKLLLQIHEIFVKHGFNLVKVAEDFGTPNWSDVKTWQVALNELGFHVPVSGFLDAPTFRAVKDFQRMAGFLNEDIDGIPGPKTVGELSRQVANHKL